MFKKLISFLKSKLTQPSKQTVSTVSRPTIVPVTPTQTISSGTPPKETKPTPSAPTAKKAIPSSKSSQSPKKATSPRTKKRAK